MYFCWAVHIYVRMVRYGMKIYGINSQESRISCDDNADNSNNG